MKKITMALSLFFITLYSQADNLSGKAIYCENSDKFKPVRTTDQLKKYSWSIVGYVFADEQFVNKYTPTAYSSGTHPYKVTDGYFVDRGNESNRITYSAYDQNIYIKEVDKDCFDERGIDNCSRTISGLNRTSLKLRKQRIFAIPGANDYFEDYSCKITTLTKLKNDMKEFSVNFYKIKERIVNNRKL